MRKGACHKLPDWPTSSHDALTLDGGAANCGSNDVGCGPGIVALRFALPAGSVVVDAHKEVIEEAIRRSAQLGVTNAQWVWMRAKVFPAQLGSFRTQPRSVLLPTRPIPVSRLRCSRCSSPKAAWCTSRGGPLWPGTRTRQPPIPASPYAAMKSLVDEHLRTVDGQKKIISLGTPEDEASVLIRAGFDGPRD